MAIRMRTIPEAYQELRKADPHTAITYNALRKMVITGRIPHIPVGNKRLVNMDDVERVLCSTEVSA